VARGNSWEIALSEKQKKVNSNNFNLVPPQVSVRFTAEVLFLLLLILAVIFLFDAKKMKKALGTTVETVLPIR